MISWEVISNVIGALLVLVVMFVVFSQINKSQRLIAKEHEDWRNEIKRNKEVQGK